MLLESSSGGVTESDGGWQTVQTEGAATENARPAMSVRVHGMISSGAADDRMSLRYDGADVVRTLCVSYASVTITRSRYVEPEVLVDGDAE